MTMPSMVVQAILQPARVRLRDSRLTYSQLSAMGQCPRKHYLAYCHGIRQERKARALRMGSGIHLALDLRAQGKNSDDAVQAMLDDYDKTPPANEEDQYDWDVERETAARLAAAYFWRWAEEDEGVEIIETERVFDVPLINPDSGRASRTYTKAGKRDKIIRDREGKIAVMEHKTTSQDIEPTADYWRRLRIDSQISIYFESAKQDGHDVQYILYDVIRKPTIRPRQIPLTDGDGVKIVVDAAGQRVKTKDGKKWRESGSTEDGYTLQTRPERAEEFGERLTADIGARPEFYFGRQMIFRDERMMEEAAFDTYQKAQMIHECDKAGRWPRNSGACIGFGKCPYFDLCTSGFNPDEPGARLPEGYVRVENTHQELGED